MRAPSWDPSAVASTRPPPSSFDIPHTQRVTLLITGSTSTAPTSLLGYICLATYLPCLYLPPYLPNTFVFIHVIHGRDVAPLITPQSNPRNLLLRRRAPFVSCNSGATLFFFPHLQTWANISFPERLPVGTQTPVASRFVYSNEETTRRPRAAAVMASDAACDADADANTIAIY